MDTNKIERARELFTRLAAGDTSGYGGAELVMAELMVDDIQKNLKNAGADAAALDPTGSKSASDMNKALKDAVSGLQVKHAQKLFTRLAAGDTSGYGGAESMAYDIQKNLKNAGADAAALDPTGNKSASDMNKALKDAVSGLQVKHARKLFTRLLAGDTSDYGGTELVMAELMVDFIQKNLKNAGADAAALDPTGNKSASDMNKALKDAISGLQVKHARKLFTRLLAGDTAGYSGAQSMASAIRTNLKKAGVDASSLDPSGKKTLSEIENDIGTAVSKLVRRSQIPSLTLNKYES